MDPRSPVPLQVQYVAYLYPPTLPFTFTAQVILRGRQDIRYKRGAARYPSFSQSIILAHLFTSERPGCDRDRVRFAIFATE
jgi:hypothetical protein